MGFAAPILEVQPRETCKAQNSLCHFRTELVLRTRDGQMCQFLFCLCLFIGPFQFHINLWFFFKSKWKRIFKYGLKYMEWIRSVLKNAVLKLSPTVNIYIVVWDYDEGVLVCATNFNAYHAELVSLMNSKMIAPCLCSSIFPLGQILS